jgi:hypothetical protein
MKRAWAEVARLQRINATHRKGFRVNDLVPAEIIAHIQEELGELRAAPHDIEELADTMVVLIHYALKHGWSMLDVEAAILRKLSLRFPDAYELEEKDAK